MIKALILLAVLLSALLCFVAAFMALAINSALGFIIMAVCGLAFIGLYAMLEGVFDKE